MLFPDYPRFISQLTFGIRTSPLIWRPFPRNCACLPATSIVDGILVACAVSSGSSWQRLLETRRRDRESSHEWLTRSTTLMGWVAALLIRGVVEAQVAPSPPPPAPAPAAAPGVGGELDRLARQLSDRVRELGDRVSANLGNTPAGAVLLQDARELTQAVDEFRQALRSTSGRAAAAAALFRGRLELASSARPARPDRCLISPGGCRGEAGGRGRRTASQGPGSECLPCRLLRRAGFAGRDARDPAPGANPGRSCRGAAGRRPRRHARAGRFAAGRGGDEPGSERGHFS